MGFEPTRHEMAEATRQDMMAILEAAGVEISNRVTTVELRELLAEDRRALDDIGGALNDDGSRIELPDGTQGPADNRDNNQNPLTEERRRANQQVGDQDALIRQGDDEMERELARLRRRHEILRLQREIEMMERGEEPQQTNEVRRTAGPPPNMHVKKIHFQDIEHSIVKFNGEDRTYSVTDFFRHLDQIFEPIVVRGGPTRGRS